MDNKPNKIYFYLAIALCAAAAVLFGLSFTAVGIYALISSILCGIASLSFCSVQKKKYDFPQIKYAKIAAYIMLALSVLLFLGGLIYSALV